MLQGNHTSRGTVQVGPFELGYVIEGNGPNTLVIGSSIYYPRTFSPALREHLRLAFVDHRGFAQKTEDTTPADYTLQVVIDDMERMRQELELGKIIVIGHSGHGYLALEYAKKYPENVSHVVVICTGPSHSAKHTTMTEQHFQEAVCPERKEQLTKDWEKLPDQLAAAPEKRFITFCLAMGARSWYDEKFDAASLWEGVQVNMEIIDHLWGETFRDLDIRSGLRELACPVLLALGRFDYLVAPAHAWEPYRECFRDLTVRVFDRSSHTPQFEQAQLFDQELIAWLTKDR